jgi:hypothetical protein
MSEENFIVKEHIVPCQHIREEFITSSLDDPAWRMQVKQYIPRNNPTPNEGDITIISSHANAFPKVGLFLNLIPTFTSQILNRNSMSPSRTIFYRA